jgi:hypothetical protein
MKLKGTPLVVALITAILFLSGCAGGGSDSVTTITKGQHLIDRRSVAEENARRNESAERNADNIRINSIKKDQAEADKLENVKPTRLSGSASQDSWQGILLAVGISWIGKLFNGKTDTPIEEAAVKTGEVVSGALDTAEERAAKAEAKAKEAQEKAEKEKAAAEKVLAKGTIPNIPSVPEIPGQVTLPNQKQGQASTENPDEHKSTGDGMIKIDDLGYKICQNNVVPFDGQVQVIFTTAEDSLGGN